TSFYYWCFVKGTALLPSGIAGMVSGAIPFCAMGVTLICLKSEQVTWKKGLGIFVGFLGVACMARPWQSGAVDLVGVSYILVGCLSLGASFVYTRKYLSPTGLSAMTLSIYQMGFALAGLLPITDYSGMGAIAASPGALVGCLLGLGLIGTGLAFALYYHIVDELGAVTASSVSYLAPVVAFFIGWLIMGEPVHATDFLAMAFIFSGVFLLRDSSERTPTNHVSPTLKSHAGNLH
ncbi:MAG: DMT family transporter, partial [Desulfobacterales bacterium]|nr:DMT family transporter [Desulfobacterales bacterium]